MKKWLAEEISVSLSLLNRAMAHATGCAQCGQEGGQSRHNDLHN